ncbi:transposase [Roseateles sp. BYS180W]|uniref:Transposase n=1 Tax=Roseateles rivi TaxID=3299028 RepID=A0ABW7FYR0_9BURK
MKQTSLGLGQSSKRTRRRVFLEEMDRVVPWNELVALISPYMPEGRRGRPPFAVEVMLRVHFMQQWFNLSDPAIEEALHDMALFRDFAGLEGWEGAGHKVEHPFRVIKRQFGHVKVRYRGLVKNTAQLHALFALSNLWMVRRQLGGVQA